MISVGFEEKYNTVTNIIKELQKSLDPEYCKEHNIICFKRTIGQYKDFYHMNENMFLLIVMRLNGKKAIEWSMEHMVEIGIKKEENKLVKKHKKEVKNLSELDKENVKKDPIVLKNEMFLFSKKDFCKIRDLEINHKIPYAGFVYLLPWGNKIKIGCTGKVSNRIKTLISQAEGYGGKKVNWCIISAPHTNYRENEHILHKHFSNYRINGTELFLISKERILDDIKNNVIILNEQNVIKRSINDNFNFFIQRFVPCLQGHE